MASPLFDVAQLLFAAISLLRTNNLEERCKTQKKKPFFYR